MKPIRLRTHNGGTLYVFQPLAEVINAFDRAQRTANNMVRLDGRAFPAASIRAIEHGVDQVLEHDFTKPVRVMGGGSARTGRRPLPPPGLGGQRSGGVASHREATR